MIEPGKKVTMRYHVYYEDGTLAESDDGKHVVSFIYGEDDMIEGLEDLLAGKKEGDMIEEILSPEKAFGERDESHVGEIESAIIPKHYQKVGMILAHTKDGLERRFMITEIGKDKLKVDYNHPLSGFTLKFKVEVIKVV